MGWGRTWGRVWGGGAAIGTEFEILSAIASGSNSFRVTFSMAPLFRSPIYSGDASRLGNWELTRTDASQTLTLLTVRAVSGDDTTIEFIIAERWESQLAEYQIEGSGDIESAAWQKKLVTPATATFYGSPEPLPTAERQELIVDLYNPQNDSGTGFVNGGLSVATSGDYNVESGVTLVKKLILRELLTAQGEFLHLADSEWGEGIEAKDLYNATDLISFRRGILLRVQALRWVKEASVTVNQYADNRLEIGIKARTDFGDVELSAPVKGVSF